MRNLIASVLTLVLVLSFSISAQEKSSDKDSGHKHEVVKSAAPATESTAAVNTVCPVSGEELEDNKHTIKYENKTVDVATLAKRITSVEELKAPSIPKVVFDYNNFALYFSRSPIPYVRDAKTNIERVSLAEIYKHIGLYVYRRDSLLKFTSLPPTDLEQIEKLEQLRMLENGMKIKIVVTEFESISVDTPEDLDRARVYYNRYVKTGKNTDY